MDNLALRRALAIAGIVVITAGIIGMAYGILKNNPIVQLLGLAGVIVAYLLSVLVKRLRKINEEKEGK